jgi:hypothetical protein
LLLKTFLGGIETERSDFQSFDALKIAHQITLRKEGKPAMRIRVTEVAPAPPLSAKDFELKGHEWQRAFTAEER